MNYTKFRDTFISLTKKTVPYGTEREFVAEVFRKFCPFELKTDGINYFTRVGNWRDTIFTSHLDTASWDCSNVSMVGSGEIIFTDGETILGADDKAGVTIMLDMIESGVDGTYYFFIGEESGRIGSSYAAKKFPEYFKEFKRMISFDRRLQESIISHQLGSRCCSDDFVEQLGEQYLEHDMLFVGDRGGLYTDSASFMNLIPECTNISVGYNNEHSTREYIDMQYCYNVSQASKKVDWTSLPVKRLATPSFYDEDDDGYFYFRNYS